MGCTRKGKGTKWSLTVDGNGTPLAHVLASAQVAEIRLAPQVLQRVCIRRGRGRPQKVLGKVIADRAYDSRAFRARLKRQGTAPCIPKRRPPRRRACRKPLSAHKLRGPRGYRQRWVVERTFAWVGTHRRLVVRYDRLLEAYEGFFTLALIRIVLRKFRRHRR